MVSQPQDKLQWQEAENRVKSHPVEGFGGLKVIS